ncbi:hypothetical protein KAFR_0E04300 [Kazachstania africana CBS 2517]|uniref:Nascent polypeptide-associated complex subunit alpha n=1 Tax=Kazachstania africana (strain ATCC 22294 / BCRC 22015 / CBS 2517 / CECT 1963 / NBRC 1671 / NRRL Y-8276) TaxID=1071382 RepID=H2AW31_KAZAF|nr:hypothetical protein KAFR_0E04300 [Kazachstania africana CBS 2517]CCF58581.1 hypothetical protein KAFR_0E04300 [Kazachstania africana CBS 2517]
MTEEGNVTILSRNERRSRENLMKLGLKPVSGVNRVTFKKKDNQIFAINNPDVFRSVSGNYVVFGEVTVDNFAQKLAAVQKEAQSSGIFPTATKSTEEIAQDIGVFKEEKGNEEMEEAAVEAVQDAEEDVDIGNLPPEDVDLVMQQANVSRSRAIKMLKENNGDLISAIMAASS